MASKHYNNPKFKAVSGLLREIFKGECEVCRNKKYDIEIHHIDNKEVNPSIENLLHCCSECHLIVENSKVDKLYHLKLVREYLKKYLDHITEIEFDLIVPEGKSYPFGHPISDD